MRFEFIRAESAQFPIRLLCKMMGVSKSGYYAWRDRRPSKCARENAILKSEIRVVHAESRGTYGSPRVHQELRKYRSVGRHRVARLMAEEGLQGCRPRRFRRTTDSQHMHPIAPNVLKRNFAATRPDEKWVGDITAIWTGEGWLYLAVLIDLFSRKVVGWAMADHMRTELALMALRMATGRRRSPKDVVHHTDRGCQYASQNYSDNLLAAGITPSMSRTGNCWDNAVAESFFATLKKELVHRYRWPERRDAQNAIAEYIEVFYNNRRIHSTIGYVSPADFEALNVNHFPAMLAA